MNAKCCLLGLGLLLGTTLLSLGDSACADEPSPGLSQAEGADLAKEAQALNAQAVRLYGQGRYAEATTLLEKALAMQQRLYPSEKYPDGHHDLAASLSWLGFLLQAQGKLVQAEPYHREALAMCQRLYPKDKYPNGHPGLAASLTGLASLLQARGELVQAETLFRDALAMCQRLYPKDKYPDGHPQLSISLDNLASLLQARGELVQAEPYYREALAMKERLYPKTKFPDGHPHLAASLDKLAILLREQGELMQAEPLYRDALAIYQRLYPKDKYPNGHPDLAGSLNNLALLLQARGELAQAEPYYRDALAIYQRFYPTAKYPNGHPDLAQNLYNLASLLQARGELMQAEPYYRDALAMRQRLYPKAKYANGHPDLAQSLNNLALLLQARGELMQADPHYREALAMYRRLYPKDKYPDGHPDLAASLNNLAYLLQARGELMQAEPYYQDALAMCKRLYPTAKYPNGHPHLAGNLNNLAGLLWARGDLAQAEPYCRDALAMYQRLYPTDTYPDGHPELARSLINLAGLLQTRGELVQAEPYYRHALVMYQRLALAFAELGAEAETLNLLASLPRNRDAFLDISAQLSDAPTAKSYALLWQGKALLARVLERRQRLLRGLSDPEARAKLSELLHVRQTLAALVLASPSAGKDSDRAVRLKALTERRERLERELAQAIPALARAQGREHATPKELVAALPPATAFVDLYRYGVWDVKQRRWGEARYTAFVLASGRSPQRAELGPAKAIEEALAQWRQAIAEELPSDAGGTLRRLVWDKLELPPGTHMVYLCPDGELSALPWAALPGQEPGKVLLEECAVALVPHGPLLLEQLTASLPLTTPAGKLLALGGVDYDRAAPPRRPAEELLALRPADRSGRDGTWPPLPGTAREVEQVLALARRLPQASEVLERRGSAATTQQLLEDLPRAQLAHLATHGFFAAPKSKERERLYEPQAFEMLGRVRVGAAARHPLTQTGLVLAGANQPPAQGTDPGILTAEALAGLPLDKLELAVLSACQTGLGEAATGEGVFGLQRAFHLAGCRTVVASLWKVDDDATAALMALFYHQLWVEKRSPLEALRQAQLALYRNPGEVGKLAKARGQDFDETVRRVSRPPAPKAERPPGTAPVKHWAAFVLSGAGR